MNEDWDVVVSPKRSWSLGIKAIWHYRDLVALLVRRDFVALYKQTILGPFWFFLQPILTSFALTAIFGYVAKLPTGGLPPMAFYLGGLVLWNYFADMVNKTSLTFISNASIFGKVFFPRMVVPISISISGALRMLIQFGVFLVTLLWYYLQGVHFSIQPHILLLPVLFLFTICMGLGLGLVISAITTKYRDISFLIGFALQLMMYFSSVVYPVSNASGKWRIIMLLNPMTSVIETFKFAFTGQGYFSWAALGASGAFSILVLLAGMAIFSRIEKTFMDTV